MGHTVHDSNGKVSPPLMSSHFPSTARVSTYQLPADSVLNLSSDRLRPSGPRKEQCRGEQEPLLRTLLEV